jgi:hypothetical protein
MMLSKQTTRAAAGVVIKPTVCVLATVNPTSLHNNNNNHHQYQQSRTILGISSALDKRIYRMAKGVMPPISKTEQIALGCGTIGTFKLVLLVGRY